MERLTERQASRVTFAAACAFAPSFYLQLIERKRPNVLTYIHARMQKPTGASANPTAELQACLRGRDMARLTCPSETLSDLTRSEEVIAGGAVQSAGLEEEEEEDKRRGGGPVQMCCAGRMRREGPA